MGYYLSEYLNELYSNEKQTTRKLGKYKINSYIDGLGDGFYIFVYCTELKIKEKAKLGLDIKLSVFPEYYDEIENCFDEIAKSIFHQCKHENIVLKKNSNNWNYGDEYDYVCFGCGTSGEIDEVDGINDYLYYDFNWEEC